MSAKKVLFVDLLYSKHGSYDDDFEAIHSALPDLDCDYLRCDVRHGVRSVLRALVRVLSFRYVKVVFLSAKIYQLVMLAPIGLFLETYAIYHFMPNSRVRLHSRLLPVLSRCFRFATYSDAVSNLFSRESSDRPPVLPQRIVDRAESERLLRKKFSAVDVLRVLIPGVRPGVRKFIEPQELLKKLRKVTGARDIRLFIQCEPIAAYMDHPAIEFLSKGIPKKDYDALYLGCHVVVAVFEDNYEVRASAVVLDAIAAGCLVFTTEHAITRSYGFPNSIVCDADNIGGLIERIRSGEDIQQLIPGLGVRELAQRWSAFLKIM